MPNIKLAEKMLADLKADYKAAYNTNNCGYIDLIIYKSKYDVSDEDIKAYCQTLTPLVPIHPKCVVCGGEWQSLEKIIEPIHNGQVINFVDSFTMWCCDASHETVWFNQDKSDIVSITMECAKLAIDVRWNCHCMELACFGKTVIVNRNDYKILATFENGILPYNISEEKLKLYLALI